MRERRGVNWPDLSFAAVFLLATVAFVWTVGPFLVPIFLAAATVAVLAPAHERAVALLGGRRNLAAVLGAVAVLLVFLIPLGLVGFSIARNLVDLFGQWSAILQAGGIDALLDEAPGDWLRPLLRQIDELGLTDNLRAILEQIATFLSGQIGSLAGAVVTLSIKTFILAIAIYYFFLEGPSLLEELVAISPLAPTQTREILGDLTATLRTLFVASLVTAALQGLLGALAFTIGGLPNALLWASLMALLGLIFFLLPVIGTSLVYVPAGVWLIANGRIVGGIFVLLWGVVVIGSVEFFVKPYFARHRVRLHPLAIFLSLVGGVVTLGPVGVIAGPVIVSLVVSFGRVWRRDVVPRLARFRG